ncbi:30S ribosomal protein S2 [Candidatus Sumerlaeota bacterium]|nr:30S ribosomal protein S2 [Candidatus Sumerlaeota bacterium]
MLGQISMKQLLEAGVHFGHQSRRWNPKMTKYIYTERNQIYIIDLKKTLRLMREAYTFVRDTVAGGGKGIFIGTKKQAAEAIEKWAHFCGMYYVNNRWLGGTLTNFGTVRKSIERMIEIQKMVGDGTIERYTKKEQSMLLKEKESLEKNLQGIRNMDKLPAFIFVIDPSKEYIAVHEANKLGIPVVAVVDTNCDPDPIQYVIPGNDDAIRSINLSCEKMAEACVEGQLARVEAGLQTTDSLPDAAKQLLAQAQAEHIGAIEPGQDVGEAVSLGATPVAIPAATAPEGQIPAGPVGSHIPAAYQVPPVPAPVA